MFRLASKRLVLIFAGLIGISALGAAWYLFQGETAPAAAGKHGGPGGPWAGPVPVQTVKAQKGELQLRLRAIGTVTPLAAVTLKSRVDGELLRRSFKDGQFVRKGELLMEIDPAPYRVKLDQAEGQQQQNLAQLRNAETELARYRKLFEQDSIARQQVEAQEALVNQLKGTLKSDKAQVDEARLQLGWTRIEAPISGRVGLSRVDPGNLVSSGDAEGLLSITQVKPIAVIFTIPEQELALVREEMAAGRRLTVEAHDREDRRLLAAGFLLTHDNQIDTATGTVRLKAEFANEDEALFPNQFVNTRLLVRTLKDVVTVPADAVQHGNKGTYVYVVQDGKASIRQVRLGASDGSRVVVEEGLQGGEPVVLEGLDRLREGKEVILLEDGDKPAAQPAAKPAGQGRPGRGG